MKGHLKNYLNKPVLIDCCKDRTLTYRRRGTKSFNKVALPVYSVENEKEANDLILTVGSLQYDEHPLMPGKPWRKINIDFKQFLDITDLDRVTEKLHDVYQRITKS